MNFFKKRQELFLQNIWLKSNVLLLYSLFLGIYFLNDDRSESELLPFLLVHKNGGSFFIELFGNINWFLFYFVGLLLPLDYFQNLLLRQSIFEAIRKNHKRKVFMEFLFSIVVYSSLFVGTIMFIDLLVGNRRGSFYSIGLLFLVLVLTMSMLVITQVMVSFFIEGYTGFFVSLGLVLICFYYDRVSLVIPTQNFSLAAEKQFILINSVLALALLCLIKRIYTKKELI